MKSHFLGEEKRAVEIRIDSNPPSDLYFLYFLLFFTALSRMMPPWAVS
jgi:hypothetical protein